MIFDWVCLLISFSSTEETWLKSIMLRSFTNLSRVGKSKRIKKFVQHLLAWFSLWTGAPRVIIARSIFFRDKKSENHPPEPFKSSVPPHLEKQQQKALEEYKNNEDPSLKCYGKWFISSIEIFSTNSSVFSECQRTSTIIGYVSNNKTWFASTSLDWFIKRFDYFMNTLFICISMDCRFYDCTRLDITWTDNDQLSIWERSTFSSKTFELGFSNDVHLCICRDFVVNMLCVAMHRVKNVVLHANYAKQFVPLK